MIQSFFHQSHTAMQRWFFPQLTVMTLVIAHSVCACIPAAIACGLGGSQCHTNGCCCSLSNSSDAGREGSCCQQPSADRSCGCSDHHLPLGNLSASGSDELRMQDIRQCNRLASPHLDALPLVQCNRFSFFGYFSMDTCSRAILCIWQV